MKNPTQAEYETARRALDAYEAFAAPYVQRNGWTVIPADAPRPLFEGAPLDADTIHGYSTIVEIFEMLRDRPERLFAYVASGSADGKSDWRVTTWTGEVLSVDLIAGPSYRNPRPSYTSDTITPIRVKMAWGDWYHGRALGPGVYVNPRKVKAQ